MASSESCSPSFRDGATHPTYRDAGVQVYDAFGHDSTSRVAV
ncbi:hypothetical protein LINGRAHAP2_LOCUS10263 [Linum grandiflorum]